jgi:hypothetical protein
LLPRHPPNALIALDPIQKTTGPFACGWFNHNPSSVSGRKSLTRRRSLGRGRAAVASPERLLSEPDRTHGQCHLTWKDCCRCNEPGGPIARRPPHLANARTASRVLLSSRCQSASVRRMSPPGASVSCRLARAIGQEGSSATNLPIGSLASSREDAGGAYRDRTGDLMLAKHALSQLS